MEHSRATDTLTDPAPRPIALPWRDRLRMRISSEQITGALLALILIVAAAFRLTGVAWDENKHLHPDERFLTQVANDIRWPENLDTYFDPAASPLSPFSLQNMGLYVYGTLPLWLVKGAAILLGQDSYDSISIVGRVMSALFDLGTIAALFVIGRRLYGAAVGLLGAALLALSVMNIQLSHFFTVDTFANLFVLLAILFALRICERGLWRDYVAVGLALGAGMASKLSVVTLALPILLAFGWDVVRRARAREAPAHILLERSALRLLTLLLVAGLSFRVLQPISFQGPDFWNMALNPTWQEDVDEQQKILVGEIDAPPWHQWTDRPALIFPLQNMLLWGMGLPLGIAAWAGFLLMAHELVRRGRWLHLIPLAYVGATFVYHGTLWVKFMRYFLPIYPLLALFAAYMLVWLYRQIRALPIPRARLASLLPGVVVVGGTLLWAIGFTSIYTRPHTRVEASRWIIANIPHGSAVANEHWDDWLPLPIGDVDMYGQRLIEGLEIPNYEDDTPEKLDRVVDILSRADYLVLSSNRLYDSIPRLPMRYPMATRYYELLLSEQLGFRRVAEFTSYPQILGLQIPDQSSEESFTVYDHPRVQIFQKQPGFDAAQVRAQLGDSINWDQVVRLTPKQATAAPDLLLLSPADRQRYQAVAAMQTPPPWAGLAAAAPLLLWALALILVGVAALPLTLVAFARLRDRGYLLARTLGLLLVGWLAWVLASLRIAPFSWWSALLSLLVVGAISWGLGSRYRAELLPLWRAARRPILLQEGLFWGSFLLMLAIRWQNPDLWHPGLGGEKPMDTAYLQAIATTPYFPAYDPWYAGGYINYYYFGFVLVATLIHLSGVVPTTAYNLAVPTLFAMTAAGAWCVALNLAHAMRPGLRPAPAGGNWLARALTGPRRAAAAGLLGALFVVALGNLGQLQLFWDEFKRIGTPAAEEQAVPPEAAVAGPGALLGSLADRGRELVAPLPRGVDGVLQVVFNNQQFNFRPEWWYWNATRVYPAAEGEAGAITEFPFFTFLFADLHAHMMALPLTLLALAIGVALVARADPQGAEGRAPRAGRGLAGEAALLLAAALTLGALWPTNTWDFPTYAALLLGAFGLRAYVARGRVDGDMLVMAGWRWGLVVALAFLLYKPFHDSSASAYFGAEAWEGSRTPLWAYLLVHGFFLFILWSGMLSELARGENLGAPARALGALLRWRWRAGRLRRLLARGVRPTPAADLTIALLPIGAVALALLALAGHAPEALALLTAGVALLIFFSPRPDPARQVVMAMIATGALLTAAVEVVVLKGDISRMNTVFKFYLQVWVLWGCAAAALMPTLAARLAPRPGAHRGAALAWRWWGAFSLLLAGCLLYTATATPGRIRDRFEGVAGVTLDGTAYMRTARYTDQEQAIDLGSDREAIRWMRENIPGTPTIVEANTPLYRWGSRVSIYTGFPTVIGWDWHQKQQRAILPSEYVDRRIEDVRALYSDPNPDVARQMIRRYGIQYIYLGSLERIYYGGDGLSKFAQLDGQLWDKVYENSDVQIYRVRPG